MIEVQAKALKEAGIGKDDNSLIIAPLKVAVWMRRLEQVGIAEANTK